MSDSIQAITMPKWGLAMEEGMVVAWLADVGSSVEAGQDLLEIETTKITNVYEAPVAGRAIVSFASSVAPEPARAGAASRQTDARRAVGCMAFSSGESRRASTSGSQGPPRRVGR